MAAMLAGAWRSSPPPLQMRPEALAQIAPLLVKTRGESLGWWRVQQSDLRTSAPARQLRNAYRQNSMQAALQECHIQLAVTLLRSGGVEPLLIKGWAAARLYPEPGLRPYGDMDLCVRPDQLQAAMTILMAA